MSLDESVVARSREQNNKLTYVTVSLQTPRPNLKIIPWLVPNSSGIPITQHEKLTHTEAIPLTPEGMYAIILSSEKVLSVTESFKHDFLHPGRT